MTRGQEWFRRTFSARNLLYAGILLLPAFLLQKSVGIKGVQVAVFALFAVIAGKRLRYGYFVILLTSIVFFHLLLPTGRVLFEVAGLPVTEGAVLTGLQKGFTLIGMVFLSLATVRADLHLPGATGELAAKIFWTFEQIMGNRGEIVWRHPIVSIDRYLLLLHRRLRRTVEEGIDEGTESIPRFTVPGQIVLTLFVVLNWVLLLVN